ncbi:branched-chain amino acid ABC transporter permease [Agrobacterium sp. SOY23]|uniref:branched-chain amino acid ABC transporter permease n=1 Tax=Agrobacterium sp. SOY23 TaxID=3014555 RepID=UPI0022B00568|nr:branched-chain amino acid ABC transporter permease [Agrobacterium sp. SOY23]MCZ4433059.1 branched-chain amino acid ABC transporter permease [Agrobacterium sp. SOY23]
MVEFLQYSIDALSLGSIYALTALGIGLLFGILRLINFAHGDLITIGAYALIVPSSNVAAEMFIGSFDIYLMIPLICLIVVVAALLTDIAVFRPLRRAASPTLLIASFAVSYIIQNGILTIYGGRAKSVNLWNNLNQQFALGELRVPILQLVTMIATMALMLGLILFLKWTKYGKQMRAASEDFRMSQYLGIRGNLVIGLAFVISGVLATAVSLLYTTQTATVAYTMGVPLALFAFVAVVVGGMGNLAGSVIGGYLIGFLVTMLQAYLPPDLRGFRDCFAFALVILILLVRPSGLIPGRNTIERV